ncbi:hypothetical protein EDD15DRAFT_2205356 [Pisolithus albus]|nr:hypothetical protein EDD15DRAFT_2205356 [Pisolithus albus]
MQVVPNSSFANVPETPSIDSTSNGMPSVQRSRGDAVLPKGTPSAIGMLRLRSFNSASPKITYVPAAVVDQESDDIEREREEANFVLEAAHAQHNVCILEQQLAAAKVEEMVALGNLYRFRAQEAERRLEDANVDVGRIPHDICKNGVALRNPRKRRRASFAESTVACTCPQSISSFYFSDVHMKKCFLVVSVSSISPHMQFTPTLVTLQLVDPVNCIRDAYHNCVWAMLRSVGNSVPLAGHSKQPL